MSQIYSM